MNKYLKAVLVEFGWLACLYIPSYLIAVKITNGLEEISENRHDTYIILSDIPLSVFLFAILVFLAYAVRIGFQRFGNTFTNVLFTISSVYLLYISPPALFLISLFTFKLESGNGWTVYPPGQQEVDNWFEEPRLDFLSYNHWVFIFFICTIILVSFMEGRKWSRKNSASAPN